MTKKTDEVSQAEFARRVGCHRDTISKLCKAGKLRRLGNGKLNFQESEKLYKMLNRQNQGGRPKKNKTGPKLASKKPAAKKKTTKPKKPTPKKKSDKPDKSLIPDLDSIQEEDPYELEKKMKQVKLAGEILKARTAEIDHNQKKRKSINIDEIADTLMGVGSELREKLLSIIADCSNKSVGKAKGEIVKIWDTKINEIFQEYHDRSKAIFDNIAKGNNG
jgi:hypothetical protein